MSDINIWNDFERELVFYKLHNTNQEIYGAYSSNSFPVTRT